MSQENNHNQESTSHREQYHILKEASAIMHIKNLMATRAFYHAALRHDLEMTLFSCRPDISWGQNHGFFVGRDSIENYYVRLHFKKMEEINTLQGGSVGSEGDIRKSRGRGFYAVHALTNPLIYVAKDLESAKAVWYSPGFVIGATPLLYSAAWMFEHYAADLVFEEGWRFLHICVYTDLFIPCGTSPTTRHACAVEEHKQPVDSVANEGVTGPGASEKSNVPRPDVAKFFYELWHEDRLPAGPKLPSPYVAHGPDFSYGPPEMDATGDFN